MATRETGAVKAADIADEIFLQTVLDVFEAENGWTNIRHLRERIPGFPEKVIRAKARQLIKRNWLSGCTCGCRGDFELHPEGMDFLAERGVSNKRLKLYSRSRAIPWEPSQP